MAKVEGVSDILTDTSTRLCSFQLKNTNLDLKATLDKFAETNTHIAGWSKVEKK